MNKKNKAVFFTGVGLITAFTLWTICLCLIDVQTIGPQQSSVGFASLNKRVHSVTGANLSLYTVTDWLGLVPIGVAFAFAVLGLVQWIQRKNIRKVDYDILLLGGFYIVVIAVYILFEFVVINYRPILINGYLEASYPSSTTMLVLCVMPTAMLQLRTRIKNTAFKRCLLLFIALFIDFMVIGRILSGVHWISDVIGGALCSAGLVLIYASLYNTIPKNK